MDGNADKKAGVDRLASPQNTQQLSPWAGIRRGWPDASGFQSWALGALSGQTQPKTVGHGFPILAPTGERAHAHMFVLALGMQGFGHRGRQSRQAV